MTHERFDLDKIKREYDLIALYPATPRRRVHGDYVSDSCFLHADPHPSMLIHRDGYVCRQCGERGDIITFVMKTQGVDFVEACRRLADGQPALHMALNTTPLPKAPPPVYAPNEAADFVAAMSDRDYQTLEQRAHISREMAEAHQWGRYDAGIYTIPIRDPEGALVDVKLYRPQAPRGSLKSWHLRSGATNALYGLPWVEDDYVIIVGGEKDTVIGHQMGLPTVTATAGEASWDPAFNGRLAQFKKVYVWLDYDATGWRGTQRVRQGMPRAIACSWVLWDRQLPKGFDLTDYYAEGGTPYEFLLMLAEAERGLPGTRPSLNQQRQALRHVD